jgi:penicillin-binding protein 2
VVDGMRNVVLNGTGKIAQLDSLTICGKTGTAQNPHGKDHSIFIAFAPMDNPKIAMAVYVENAGYGATWAAPIASLMIEKYLRREVKRPEMEKKIMEANLLPRKEDKVDKK